MLAGCSSVVELLQALVAIPSINPECAPDAPAEITGEKRCAEFVGRLLEEMGAEVIFEEPKPGRPNVIGRFPRDEREWKPTILLAPHLDTVTIDGMTVDPFAGEIREGRLYGRGACDTKGTAAAMLWALHEMGAVGRAALPVHVVFVGLMAEEWCQHGSQHFGAHHADEIDFALVGEPTNCDVVVKTKGCVWPKLTASGKPAHGSSPELGDNAITKMAAAIAAIDTDFRALLKSPDWHEPLLGDSSVNIGLVSGGSQPNIVPDACSMQLDMRVTPRLFREGVIEVLANFLAQHAPGVSCDKPDLCPPLDTSLDNPFVKKLQENGAKLVGAPWFSDATWLSEAGIPCAIGGPGDIAQAHTADEYIKTDSLEEGVGFYRKFLEA